MIKIASRVGSRTGLPMVEFHWGAESGELNPHEARMHALAILAAADAAEGDAFLVKFLMKSLKFDMMQAVHLLSEFRQFKLNEGLQAQTFSGTTQDLGE